MLISNFIILWTISIILKLLIWVLSVTSYNMKFSSSNSFQRLMHSLSDSLSLPPSIPSFHSFSFVPPVYLTFFPPCFFAFLTYFFYLLNPRSSFYQWTIFKRIFPHLLNNHPWCLFHLCILTSFVICTLLPSALFMHLRTSVAYQILCFWPFFYFELIV